MASAEVADLKPDDIDQLSLRKAREAMRSRNIDPKGMRSLTEMHRALKLDIMKRDPNIRSPEDASYLMKDIHMKDEHKKEQLALLYEDIIEKALKIASMSGDPLPAQLESSMPGYMEKLKRETGRLRGKKCPILFAGETSAGKSSLLNLILGDDLLPTSHLSNTSVICEISYQEKTEAKIHHWDSSKPPILIKDGDDFKKQLEEHIHTTEDRSKVFPYKMAEIFVPMPILKSGLFIVDSPGIGENQQMTELVMEYLVEAFAFIYVINSATAGGVQANRLQALLREVAQKRSPDDQQRFSANAAIFVCNKWDQVPHKEREDVMKDTITKLSDCWPGCTEKQIFLMNTLEAEHFFKLGYISWDFDNLLTGIQQLVPVSLENKISFSFSLIHAFVKRVTHHLNSYINQSEKTKEQRLETYTNIQDRLQKLQRQADSFIKDLWTEVNGKTNEALKLLKDHLKDKDLIKELSVWLDSDVPSGTKWKEVELTIKEKVIERITKALENHEKRTKYFKNIRKSLIDRFKEKFQGIEKQLNAVEGMIASHDAFLVSNIFKDRRESASEAVSDDNDLDITSTYDFFMKHRIILGISAPVLVPVGIVAAIVAVPIFGAIAVKKKIASSLGDQEFKKYQSDPVEYLTKYTQNEIQKFRKSKGLEKYVKSELAQAYMCLEQIQEAVPQQIKADQDQIESLRNDHRQAADYLKMYHPLKEMFDTMKKRLVYFKVLSIRRDKFDIDFENVTSSTEDVICSGLKAKIIRATMKGKDGRKQDVSMRQSKEGLFHYTISDYLEEERAYSLVSHPNVIKFFGVTRDLNYMYHILEPLQCSLRQHLLETDELSFGMDEEKKYAILLSKMAQVVRGLGYLHERNNRSWVHFDLTLDTVGVDMTGVIKLTNISHRKILQIDHNSPNYAAADYAHLPFEILQNPPSTYNATSDMYSFGVMMYEMWTGEKAFADQEFETLATFVTYIETERPSCRAFMYDDKNYTSESAEKWKQTLDRCMDPAPSKRLNTKDWMYVMGVGKNANDGQGLYVKQGHF